MRSRNVQAEGTAESCITTKALENWKESDGSAEGEDIIKNVTAIAFLGELEFFFTDNTALSKFKFDSRGRYREYYSTAAD